MPPTADPSDPARLREYGNVGGNVYDKYGTRNPIARRLMAGFLGAFDSLVAQAAPTSVFEIGCGEGELSLRLLERGLVVHGYDVEPEVVARANASGRARGWGERFGVRSLYALDPGEVQADLIICCEVLEHLPDPARALDILARQKAKYVLLSVPREPIWRAMNMARGKYVTKLGNTPGHLQHWSRPAFRRLVATRFDLAAERSPLPWTMLLVRPKPAPAPLAAEASLSSPE